MTDLTEAFGCDDLRVQAARVRALARSVVADAHLADDVTQQFLLGHLTDRPQAGTGGPGWIAGALRNLARRSWRGDERRRRRERAAGHPEPEGSPAEAVQNAETLQLVVAAAMALEEPYRETILLRYLEDRGVEDVARAMGVPPSTVRVRTKRGLEKLRRRLRGELGAAYAVVLLRFGHAPPEVVAAASTSAGPGDPSATAPLTDLQGTTSMRPLLLSTAAVGAVSIATVALLWNREDRGIVDPGAGPVVHGAATALAKDAELASASGRRPIAGAEVEAQAPAAVGPVLRGRVVDARGRALGGARITAFEHRATRLYDTVGDVARPAGSAPADAGGAFVLAGLPASSLWDLVVEADGYATVFSQHGQGDRDRIVLHREAAMTGVVRDAKGQALPGVAVRAQGCELDGSLRLARQTTTDGRGAYRLSGLAAEQAVTLEIGRPGSVPHRFTVNLQAGTDNVRDFELRPVRSLVLTAVERDTGRAVAGAAVSWHGLAVDALGHTDAYGVLRLDVPRRQPRTGDFLGEVGFLVHGEGFAATLTRLRDLDDALTVPLARGGRIEGTVVDPEGRAVAGAEVFWAVQPFHFMSGRDAGGVATLRGAALVGPDSRRAVTDASGRFTLPHVVVNERPRFVESGRLAVRAGARTVIVVNALPAESGIPRELRVSMRPGLSLTGRVTLNGRGDSAWVLIEGEGDGMQSSVRAEVDGSFGFADLRPGTYGISAQSVESPASLDSRRIELDGDVRGLELAMAGELAELRGTVLRDDGSPATGIHVTARPDRDGPKLVVRLDDITDTEEVIETEEFGEAPPGASGGAFAPAGGSAEVADDGSFRIAVDAAADDARYRVAVLDQGLEVSAGGVEPGGDPVTLRLPSFVPVRFAVADVTDRDRVWARWEHPATGRSAAVDASMTIPTSDGIVMMQLPVGEVRVTLREERSERTAVLDLSVPVAGLDETVPVALGK